MNNMEDYKIIFKIATICGYKDLSLEKWCGQIELKPCYTHIQKNGNKSKQALPDYVNDFNCIFDAISHLSSGENDVFTKLFNKLDLFNRVTCRNLALIFIQAIENKI